MSVVRWSECPICLLDGPDNEPCQCRDERNSQLTPEQREIRSLRKRLAEASAAVKVQALTLAHATHALEQSRQDVAAAEQRATRAERELERWRLRLRLRHDPLPASDDWLAYRAHVQTQKARGVHAGKGGVQPPFPAQVMAHLREWVRMPGDDRPEDIAEHHVCPGCHAVDGPCLPGCIDAEIAADRERDREGPAWEQDEEGS